MKPIHSIIFFIPILLIGIVFLNKILFGINEPNYRDLASEDNLIENLTVYAYFIAFGVSLYLLRHIIKHIKKNEALVLTFLFLSLIFITVGLEEISYGQRIIGFNDFMFRGNTQGEVNIHNLDLVQPYRHFYYIIASFLGAFSWVIFPRIKFFARNQLFIKYALPPKFLFSYFISVLAVVSVMKYIPAQFIYGNVTFGFFINYDSEFFELILALGLMFYVINSFLEIRRSMLV